LAFAAFDHPIPPCESDDLNEITARALAPTSIFGPYYFGSIWIQIGLEAVSVGATIRAFGIAAMSSVIDLVLFVTEGRALILDEKLTQHGRDGIFPSVRILSGPPMADAVIASTIFHPHFPSMRAM
jgi:hypothetical protein